MSSTHSHVSACPSCGDRPENLAALYGFCVRCEDFGPAHIDYDPHNSVPYVRGGGFDKCCLLSLHSWAVYNTQPWPNGAKVHCYFRPHDELHVMKLCYCDCWHWVGGMCGPRETV